MNVQLKELRYAVTLAHAASRLAAPSVVRAIGLAVRDGALELTAGGGGPFLRQVLQPEAPSLLPAEPVVLPAEVLHAAVTGLRGEEVRVSLDGGLRLEVDGYKVNVIPLEEAPENPESPLAGGARLRLPAKAFYEALRYVAQALPKGDEQPRFEKVLLEVEPGGALHLYATDGFWLTAAEVRGAGEGLPEAPAQLGLHRSYVGLLHFLSRAGLEEEATLSFDFSARRLGITDGEGRELVLPGSEADFPDFSNFLAGGQPTRIVVDAEALATAVRRMRSLISKKDPIHLYFVAEAQRLLLRARGDYGSAEANLEVRGAGPSFRLAFAPRYLLPSLTGLGQATLAVGGQRDPLLVEGEQTRAVVMPLLVDSTGVWSDFDEPAAGRAA